MTAPKFRVKHVGINHKSAAEAEKTAQKAMSLFGLARGDEDETHIFTGDIFEIMKIDTIGRLGHIALQCDDVEAALDYLAEKGIGVQEDTVKRDGNGRRTFAYLDLDLAGFAVHLTV